MRRVNLWGGGASDVQQQTIATETNSALPQVDAIAVRASVSAGKVISQLPSRRSFDSIPLSCCYLMWPCSDKLVSLAAQWETALLESPIMKYITLLHLYGITLWLVRKIYQEDADLSASRAFPRPLVQAQLFLNEGNTVQITSHVVTHL